MTAADPKSLRQLLDAVVAVGSGLDLPTMLHRIVALAADLVDARYGALGVLDDTGTSLSDFITVGVDEQARQAVGRLPEGHGILGSLIVDAEPIRLADLHQHPDSFGFPPNHPDMKSFLGVPVTVGDRVFGNLYLAEKTTAEAFDDVDEELVVGLAAAAGVAIENARLHARVGELALAEDRERIARDLHDTVIQRLFATGLSLQGTVPLIERDPAAAVARVEAAVDDLDETVKGIRTAIFALESSHRHGHGVRDRVLALCREAAGALGFEPHLVFDGPVDSRLSDDVASDLSAVLREALSNAARHARARRVDVSVVASGDSMVLEVRDDGTGIPEDRGHGHGLPNMATRAERHGGAFRVTRAPAGGTILRWQVPLS